MLAARKSPVGSVVELDGINNNLAQTTEEAIIKEKRHNVWSHFEVRWYVRVHSFEVQRAMFFEVNKTVERSSCTDG